MGIINGVMPVFGESVLEKVCILWQQPLLEREWPKGKECKASGGGEGLVKQNGNGRGEKKRRKCTLKY